MARVTGDQMEPDFVITEFRKSLLKLAAEMPSPYSWNDVCEEYVRRAIAAGIADADAGRLIDVNEVRRQYGLGPCE